MTPIARPTGTFDLPFKNKLLRRFAILFRNFHDRLPLSNRKTFSLSLGELREVRL